MMCLGCPDVIYCNEHYKQHRNDLNIELQVLTDKCNQFQEEVEIQTKNSPMHPLMRTIDEWEKTSIAKIRQVAQETREKLLQNINNFIPQARAELENLRIKVHQDPDNCEFMDTDIKNWTEELERLKSSLRSPPNINIQEIPTEFITKIRLDVAGNLES